MPQTRIRPARDADLKTIHDLVQRTIDVCYPVDYPVEAVDYFKDYHSFDNLRAGAGEEYMVVLEQDGKITGTGSLVENTIKRVFVEPDHQHYGLGKLLMEHLEEQARQRGIDTVFLHASLASKRFYDSLGYQVEEFRRIPVRNGQTLNYHYMSKRLA